MFIAKDKNILKNFYSTIFPWLERCENIFGFKKDGYGSTRIYAFLYVLLGIGIVVFISILHFLYLF